MSGFDISVVFQVSRMSWTNETTKNVIRESEFLVVHFLWGKWIFLPVIAFNPETMADRILKYVK